mgnify:CR=1 FL=1
MRKNNYSLTPESLEKLKEELENLKQQRKEVIDRIKLAKSFGDLSENSEYSEAREAQGLLESRIAEIENIIRNAKIIKVNNLNSRIVNLGSTVFIDPVRKQDGEPKVIKIVSSFEVSPETNAVSDDSPLGKALLNKMVGDVVTVKTPKKEIQYKIIKIT